MAPEESTVWVCLVCGYEHAGDVPPDECPVCAAPADQFKKQPAPTSEAAAAPSTSLEPEHLREYLSQWVRPEDTLEEKYTRIVALAMGRGSQIAPMRTQQAFPDWRTVLFKGAQLHRLPLNEDEEVSLRTVVGETAAFPLVIAIPFYVSHMSFGALSREAKIALARGSKIVGTAMCSGEGGMLPEERAEAGAYIYELGTATFSHKEDAIKQADAVEIKIGQAAKPGMGGHLPAGKVTPEIARIRSIAPGEASVSPGRHTGIGSCEDLKRRVSEIRELCGGKPVGIKFAAGHVEEDLECALFAGPDFVTIDCRGGATGAAPLYVKDNVCLPPIFALRRARRFLDRAHSRVTLCITGGFRDSADIAKAIALGADAVALATTSLIAIGCQQYRICDTGRCPVGITTQDVELRQRFDVAKSVERFVNFYRATRDELANLVRLNGRADVHHMDLTDVVTISNEVSQNTDIEHA